MVLRTKLIDKSCFIRSAKVEIISYNKKVFHGSLFKTPILCCQTVSV